MEPGSLLFYNAKPAGVLSPRKQQDNNKLPSISRAKSPESSYAQRNMEHLKQLQEKRMKQQELIEKSRKKEEDEREKLKQLVLEEAARVREQRKQKEIQDKENLDAIEAERKENLAKLKEEEKEKNKNKNEELDKEKDDKTKLYHYYRSRHVSFLQSLKETQRSRKEKEDQEKKKKDELMNKLRESMGVNNVTSKFNDFEKNKEKLADKENNRDTVEEITAAYLGKSVKRPERPRSSDQKPLTAESQRVLLDKQKKTLIEIYQKKKDQLQAGEEKEKQILKQRERLKEKVLSTMRKEEEDQNQKQRTVSLSLNSLDLENMFAKDKLPKSPVSLPVIKEKQTQENNENNTEKSDPSKGKDIAKSQKSGTKKKSKKKLPTYPNITDMTLWKKRHKLDPETKVFSISGGYGDIKAALEKRGWIENPDINSPCFDLKWTLRGKDIDHGALLEGQIVNHFDKNTSITTKVGLCKNLRNLIWFNNVDIDTFYPRCFDLSDVHDYEDFIDEFKFCKAESILKQYVNACKNNDPKAKEMELKVQVAASICESKLVDPDELLEDQARLEQILVSPEEWEIISSDELTQKALALKKHEAWLAKYEITSGPKCAVGQKDKAKKKKKRKSKISKVDNNKQADGKEGEAEGENEDENELLDRVESILEEYKTKFPQFGLNGDKNIWIVKPAGLSRGRGISCFRNLVEIQDYVKGKESQWIAQKYMENPLIVHKRKFDIRQWVLVTDWNPLTVWYYEECYVRFSAEEYETENLDNKFVHLTNNSIGKYHENQNCPIFEQNMWRMENMINYMREQFGSNIFEDQIKPKMKQIVIWALECVQDMIENRKNSHEFYGFDFMIDEDFNVWLIEINSSPDMEYSTPVTKRLVQTVSDDIVKVVVDYNLCKDKKMKKEVDTGLFTLIHQSKRFVEKPLNSFGLDLFLEGKKVGK